MPWDIWLIFFVLALILPWRGRVRMRKLLAMPCVGTMERLALYASTIAFQWFAVAVVAWRAWAHGFTASQLGLTIHGRTRTLVASLVGAATIAALQWLNLRRVGRIPVEARGSLQAIAERILPQSTVELLPYLALAMTPALQRLMPRPGAWMDRLRQFLAFPMYASAVWMIWVLTQQAGPDGVIYALGGMILIAFAIWLLRLGTASSLGSWLRRGLAAAAVLLAFAAAIKIEDGAATAASTSAGPSNGVSFDGWDRYSRARMTAAAAAGKPVFVDFTAAWCITCLVNERVALETPATRKAFEQTATVKLRGDWTNRDPEITSLLKELGRAGVPLYLYWAPGAERPKILPQVLTEATIVSELTSNSQAKR